MLALPGELVAFQERQIAPAREPVNA